MIEQRIEEKPDAWEEDVPLYKVPVNPTFEVSSDAIEVRAGTNYPVQRKGASVAIVRVSFSCPLVDVPFERVALAVQEALLRRASSSEAYQADLLLGGQDTPGTIPGNEPKWDEAVIFWFSPFQNASRPALAIRTRYRQSVIAALKGALANEKERLHSGRVGNYLPDWGKLWFVDEWRAIPTVLGALVAVGLRVVFVAREGFPTAPPVDGRGLEGQKP